MSNDSVVYERHIETNPESAFEVTVALLHEGGQHLLPSNRQLIITSVKSYRPGEIDLERAFEEVTQHTIYVDGTLKGKTETGWPNMLTIVFIKHSSAKTRLKFTWAAGRDVGPLVGYIEQELGKDFKIVPVGSGQ